MDHAGYSTDNKLVRDFSRHMTLLPNSARRVVSRRTTSSSSRSGDQNKKIRKPRDSIRTTPHSSPQRTRSLHGARSTRDLTSSRASAYHQAALFHLNPYPQRPVSWQPWTSTSYDAFPYSLYYPSQYGVQPSHHDVMFPYQFASGAISLHTGLEDTEGFTTDQRSYYGLPRQHMSGNATSDWISDVTSGYDGLQQDYYTSTGSSLAANPHAVNQPVQILDDQSVDYESDDESDEANKYDLVGMGLYDKSTPESHSTLLFSNVPNASGKGLKLEEGFVPQEEEDETDVGALEDQAEPTANISPVDSVPELDFDTFEDESSRWSSFDCERTAEIPNANLVGHHQTYTTYQDLPGQHSNTMWDPTLYWMGQDTACSSDSQAVDYNVGNYYPGY